MDLQCYICMYHSAEGVKSTKCLFIDYQSIFFYFQVSGIGNVSEQQLSALGIKVCSDLYKERGLLKLLFSDLNYNYFMRISLGLGSTTLEASTERDRKSISTETTFRGTSDKEFLFKQTEELCQELAEELLEKDIFGKVFTLKIKTTDFKLKTKAHSFVEATRSCDAMVSAARRLLQHELDICNQPLSLRLIGVRMSSLMNASEVGSSRQVTLTDMFFKSVNSKGSLTSSEKSTTDSNKKNSMHPSNSDSNKKNNIHPSDGEAYIDLCEEKGVVVRGLSASSSTDHVDSSLKKGKAKSSQIDLSSLLDKKAVETKTSNFECPVCYQQVQATSFTKFNIHVDKCLQASSSKDATSTPKGSDLTSVTNRKSKIEPCESNDDPCLHRNKKEICKNDVTVTSTDDPVEGTSTLNSEDQGAFSCPICNQARFCDISLLNQHIDECLNKGAIDKLMHEKNPESVVSNDSTEKSKGSSFFGSKKCSGSSKNSVSLLSHPRKKQKTVNNTLEKYFTSSGNA